MNVEMISSRGDFLKGATILVIMPHPDDETFACGGMIARAKADGAFVYVMVMSAGE